ncbi:glycosyltransferase family 1 protein [Xylona heveae TC161]|uniref:Glycosyltransferase family 1 protein n=1 Tax=Xylona heveae (strain CBS 132557 / TC161) TaxID=1328760 RepID=A0A164ZZT5_XYLHT|nr:glycosyltransferase family 1 protein [Xylona heveae TC161]KZF19751.1 glycosyltransferase family 1 protein [Xylona heveae TC161]
MGRVVIISTLPASGHVNPAIPVATSLVAAGHRVLWHIGKEFAGTVERTGAMFVAAVKAPDLKELPPEPDAELSGIAAAVSTLRKLLVDRMAGQLADYEEIMQEYGKADVILADLCALGARAFSERHGIPLATLGISPLTIPAPEIPRFGTGDPPPGWLGRLMNRLMGPLGIFMLRGVTTAYVSVRAQLGLTPLPPGVTVFDHMFSTQLHLQAATPAIEYPRDPWPTYVHFVGPLLPEQPLVTPPPAPPLAESSQEQQQQKQQQPLPGTSPDKYQTSSLPQALADEMDKASSVVHITQGTLIAEPSALILPALQALANWDCLVVVTVADISVFDSVDVPPNVRIEPFIPHAQLLPHVNAIISTGGYNGVKMALACGVPLVIVPWGNDQADVAGRISWAGAAINLRSQSPSAAEILDATREILQNPKYRENARRIQAEFRQYPGGEKAVELLEDFMSKTRVGS